MIYTTLNLLSLRNVDGERLFKKRQDRVLQYYYEVDDMVQSTSLELISKSDISVYGDEG